MTRQARAYIALVLLGGAAAAVALAWDAGVTRQRLSTLVVLVGIALLTSMAPVRLARSGGTLGFTLEGGAFTAMLLAGFAAVAPLAFVGVSTVSHAIRTRDGLKTAFNVGRSGLETSLAALVFLALAPGEAAPTDTRSVGAMVAAAVIFEIVSLLVFTELFHRMAGAPRSEAARDVGQLSLVTLIGNSGYGLIIATVASVSLGVAVLAGLLMPVLYLGYRGYATALEGQRRADALNEMTHVLLDVVQDVDGPGHVLERLAAVFGARSGCLVVETSEGPAQWEVGEHGVERRDVPVLPRAGLLAEAMARDDALLEPGSDVAGRVDALAAPLRRQGVPVGAVALAQRHGVEPWDEADATLLSAIANEMAVALDNVALFDQVEQERARLEAETTKLNDILGAATDGIVSVLADGTIEAWNPGMAQITGVASAEAIGQPWHAVLRLKDQDDVDLAPTGDHVMRWAVAGERTDEPLFLQALRTDGVWRQLQCTASSVPGPDGNHRGVVLVARDVTTDRELEALKADFISTVSHELRTPLTPLKGFLATLRNPRTPLTDDQLSTIHGSMASQLTRLETLISDLLAVAELDHGRFHLRPEPLTLSEVVADAVEVEAADEFHRCSLDIEPGVLAMADPVAVVRVVRSLVSNAVKHTDGRITVSVRTCDEQVEVAIADEGQGIAAWDQQRVFNRFERLGDHLRRTQGPGLGLTIARTLARSMGGDVALASDVGVGATFTFTLPLARPRPVRLQAAPGA